MKFFDLPTTKWQPFKFFSKLNGNHFLMANIFNLHKYQTFGLLKIHNMSKSLICQQKIQFVKKLGLQSSYFLIWPFFIFPNFKWLLSKIIWNYHPFLWWISGVLMKFYYLTNIFDLHTFDNETKFFEISTEMHFVSFFFLNNRNIATSLLMIHFKMYYCALC